MAADGKNPVEQQTVCDEKMMQPFNTKSSFTEGSIYRHSQ